MLAPTIDALARDYAGRVLVAKLDVDANPATADRFEIRGIPTLLVFDDGQLVDRLVGVQPRGAIDARLQPLLAAPARCPSDSTALRPMTADRACPAYHGPHGRRAAAPICEFSAGGLVFDDDGRVLLIRARDLRNQPVWTLPKGALRPGETSADAALREVREETGYRCELVRELAPVTYWFQRDGQRIRKTVRWYLMRPLEKVGEHDHEVDEVLWTDRAEARARLRYDSDRRLLASL